MNYYFFIDFQTADIVLSCNQRVVPIVDDPRLRERVSGLTILTNLIIFFCRTLVICKESLSLFCSRKPRKTTSALSFILPKMESIVQKYRNERLTSLTMFVQSSLNAKQFDQSSVHC